MGKNKLEYFAELPLVHLWRHLDVRAYIIIIAEEPVESDLPLVYGYS